MKKCMMLLLFAALALMPTPVLADEEITVPFIIEPIQMYGQKSETTFTYMIEGTVEAGSIHLTTSHSSLLKEPSSLVIAIDDIVVQTVDLTKMDENVAELVLPLTKENLKKGEHLVTLKYDGIIKQGVCIDQHTTGNWLTIHLQSYLKLEGYKREYAMNLTKFTEDFKALGEEKTTIIIPENADNVTKSVAIRVQAQLMQFSDKQSNVEITSQPKDRHKWVVVGNPYEFTHKEVTEVLKDVAVENEGMTIGKTDPSTAYILAEDVEWIEEFVHVLFQPSLTKQLAKKHVHITSLPNTEPTTKPTFDQLNIAPIVIDTVNPETIVYYATLPYALPLQEQTIFHLELQKSSLLEYEKIDESVHNAELILQVNGTMHPVSFESLVDKETHYTIDIPVENELLMMEPNFTFQLVGNGFKTMDPCIASDKRQWVQIDTKKSAIHFSNPKANEVSNTFTHLPFPFAFEETAIVVPTFEEVSDEVYTMIMNRFRLNEQKTKIILEKEVTEDLRKTVNLILLNTNVEKMGAERSISIEELEKEGFIVGTERIITTMEQNPWNKERLVLTIEQQDGELRTTDFFEKLFAANSESTLGVYTFSGDLNFNKEQVIEENLDAPATPINGVMVTAFIGLLITLVAIIIYVVRRRTKKTI